MTLKPLKISCTTTNCEGGLHCFLQKRKRGQARRLPGPCRTCGVDLVQWNRVQARNLDDVPYTFEALSKEFIRHEFWHRDIDLKAINHARRKGRVALRSAAETRVRNSVGRMKNPREGQQTPYSGNVIYYAQHALACCCRKCIEYWHGIEAGRQLNEDEIAYFVELIMLYVGRRLRELKNEGEHVPAIRARPPDGERSQ